MQNVNQIMTFQSLKSAYVLLLLPINVGVYIILIISKAENIQRKLQKRAASIMKHVDAHPPLHRRHKKNKNLSCKILRRNKKGLLRLLLK